MSADSRRKLGALFLAALIVVPSSWCRPATSRPAIEYFSGADQRPLVQRLVVRQLASRKIAFEISSRHESGSRYAISGIAVREPEQANQDPELDDDEDSGAYPVDVYFYTRRKCSLEIRIEEGKKRRATILESGCSSFHPLAAPFETQAVLTTRETNNVVRDSY